jgi:hypothetical protein
MVLLFRGPGCTAREACPSYHSEEDRRRAPFLSSRVDSGSGVPDVASVVGRDGSIRMAYLYPDCKNDFERWYHPVNYHHWRCTGDGCGHGSRCINFHGDGDNLGMLWSPGSYADPTRLFSVAGFISVFKKSPCPIGDACLGGCVCIHYHPWEQAGETIWKQFSYSKYKTVMCFNTGCFKGQLCSFAHRKSLGSEWACVRTSACHAWRASPCFGFAAWS